jgi:hypothetical protein
MINSNQLDNAYDCLHLSVEEYSRQSKIHNTLKPVFNIHDLAFFFNSCLITWYGTDYALIFNIVKNQVDDITTIQQILLMKIFNYETLPIVNPNSITCIVHPTLSQLENLYDQI